VSTTNEIQIAEVQIGHISFWLINYENKSFLSTHNVENWNC